MKKIGISTALFAMFFLLFAAAVYPQSHTVASSDEYVSLTDPAVTTWFGADIKGSIIVSWDESTSGISSGFCDLTAYTPFPNGGKYEVSLISVISSNSNQIQGIWQVMKNGTPVIVTMGTATGLSGAIGAQISITIDSYIFVARISFRIDGALAPNEIKGQAYVDGVPLSGATARIRGGGGILDEQSTDLMGKYNFGVDPADVKRILVIFRNFDADIVVSGYVYVGGEPLVGATVEIENQVGTLATVVTNADGYYQSNHIQGAVGAGLNNIRTIIHN